jgi:hypothetical protein
MSISFASSSSSSKIKAVDYIPCHYSVLNPLFFLSSPSPIVSVSAWLTYPLTANCIHFLQLSDSSIKPTDHIKKTHELNRDELDNLLHNSEWVFSLFWSKIQQFLISKPSSNPNSRLVAAPSSPAEKTLSFVDHECHDEQSYPTVKGTFHVLHSHFDKPLILQIFEDLRTNRADFPSWNAHHSSWSLVTMAFKLIMNSNLHLDVETKK